MSLLEQCAKQIVIIETPGSYDDFGNPSTGTSASYNAIIFQKNRVVLDRTGKQVVSACEIMMSGSVSVDPESKITLPDGTQPTILAVSKTPGFDGVNVLTEVYT